MSDKSSSALGVVAALLLAALVGVVVYVAVVRSKEAQAVDNWSTGLGLAKDALSGILGIVGGGAAGGGLVLA